MTSVRFPDALLVPDHDLIERIGRGGYGEVWLARNRTTRTLRAVKIVFRDEFEDERPYQREFEGLLKFEPISRSHPSQLAILHVGRNDEAGCFYYVMELADGTDVRDQRAEVRDSERSPVSLLTSDLRPQTSGYSPRTLRSELKSRGRLPAAEVIELGRALTTALAHLHSHGLVHRDIKPANIVYVGGMPKLADIGLVTDASDACSIVGTEGYIPPEGPGSPQADLYSLGKVLYEAATGKNRRDYPALPDDLRSWPDANRLTELNAVILRACTVDPRQRYQSANQMRADFELLQCGQSVRRRRTLQHRWAICKRAGVTVVLLALAIAAALFLLRGQRVGDLHSAIPGVDALVEQGNFAILGATPERLHQAWVYFSDAVKLDPKFAPAHVGLFRVRLSEESALPHPSADAESNVRTAATKLMEIDPSLAEARMASCYIKWLDGDRVEALADARRAVKMRTGSKEGRGWVHGIYGFCLLTCGYSDQAQREFEIAARVFPTDPAIQHLLGHPHRVQRKFDLAFAQYQKSIDLVPDFFLGHLNIGSIYEEKGDLLKAIEEFQRGDLVGGEDEATKLYYLDLREALQRDGPEGYWRTRLDKALNKSPQDPHYIATIFAHFGKMSQAYKWLEKAYENEGKKLDGLWWDLCWDHNDPHFMAIARKTGLMQ